MDDNSDESSDEEEEDPLCPTIRLTKEEVEAIRAPWRLSLIVKVMGRKVGYAYLLRRLTAMWKPKGRMDLIAIDNDYFLVRFGSMEDLEFAMFEGPWMVMDHYLIVKPWELDFDPFSDTTEKVLVWVRIPCLPAEYYNMIFLRKLGNKLGRTIRIDQATSMVSRGMFARICIEVDITKRLISKFKYKNRVRHVSYEGIHMVCFTCGVYGHTPDKCPSIPKAAEGDPAVVDKEQATAALKQTEGNQRPVVGDAPFGQWMIAPGRGTRAGLRGSGKNRRMEGGRGQGGALNGMGAAQASRFAPLSMQEEGDDVQREAVGDNGEKQHGLVAEYESGDVGRGRSTDRPVRSEGDHLPKTRRGGGIGLRRAAEENEHVVVRGEQGGLVISSRVFIPNTAGDLPSSVWQATKEHHSDPPGRFDDEGDVVMDLEGFSMHHEETRAASAR
ncbi:PREDICTED: uncharacterized protein LOC109177287 [Ipomoea nil]|uniref:uncharacterized protein LOC109177287 n=1 Tax=Ipomoea nil TaxID=35883 RepID=UPI000901A73B|nr:PREDICTED: uncharacterized protein LOC109177287 [Ipomoea nil]